MAQARAAKFLNQAKNTSNAQKPLTSALIQGHPINKSSAFWRFKRDLECNEWLNKWIAPYQAVKVGKEYQGIDSKASTFKTILSPGKVSKYSDIEKEQRELDKTREHENATAEFMSAAGFHQKMDEIRKDKNLNFFDKLKAQQNLAEERSLEKEAAWLEREERGFVYKELSRSLHITAYASVKDLYGKNANTDPLRHTFFDCQQTLNSMYYRRRSYDRYVRRMADFGTHAGFCFSKVSCVSFNTPDYWVSQGLAWRLFEGRRLGYNRIQESFTFFMYMMPGREVKQARFTEEEILASTKGFRDKSLNEDYGYQNWAPEPTIARGMDPYRFPLPLGREWVGTTMDVGNAIGHLKLNQRVWGITPIHQFGCCIDFTKSLGHWVAPAPENLTDQEAATLPFAGVMFFDAMRNVLDEDCTEGKNILVIGAAGKIGTVATQILQAWGGNVLVMVCQDENDYIKINTEISHDQIFNHDHPELKSKKDIENKDSNSISPLSYFEDQHFDLIFNCSQDENRMYPYTEIIDKLKENGDYVTLNSTLFERADREPTYFQYIWNSERDHRRMRKFFRKHNRFAKWAHFSEKVADVYLQKLTDLVEAEKVKPLPIHKVYQCDDSVQAFEEFIYDDPKIMGKIVVEFDDRAM